MYCAALHCAYTAPVHVAEYNSRDGRVAGVIGRGDWMNEDGAYAAAQVLTWEPVACVPRQHSLVLVLVLMLVLLRCVAAGPGW